MMVIMTESPLFLPCLVPHLFCQWQSSTPMSTSASDCESPLHSDVNYLRTPTFTTVHPSRTRTSPPQGHHKFLWRHSLLSPVSPIRHPPQTWPVTIPTASQARPHTLTPTNFRDAIINCDNRENVTRFFVSLYSFSPEYVHAVISRLASSDQSDWCNLLQFLAYIFEAIPTIATEILAQYFAEQGQGQWQQQNFLVHF